MRDKASLQLIEDMKNLLEQNKQAVLLENVNFNKRLDALKADGDEKAVELMNEMLMLKTKIDKYEEEDEEENSYDDEEDEDLGSELGDIINDDIQQKDDDPNVEESEKEAQENGDVAMDGDAQDEESEVNDQSREDLSDISPSQ